jgi:crossover junction endodeoxyribonuclease RuvC
MVVHVFVLGIDPGLSRCGYAVVDSRPRPAKAVAIGVLRTDPSHPLPVRLAELHAELKALLDEFGPTVVAIERIFVQHNLRTAVSVGQVSGLVIAEAAARGCVIAEYSPNEVKLAVTGDGSADKAAVASMVTTLLRLTRTPSPADAADAAALALCHLAHAPLAKAIGASA